MSPDLETHENVDSFDADWLALREPVDHRSRSQSILEPLTARWDQLGWSRVLDLGSGTGSNMRWLSPRLPGAQAWSLLDHDPALLARVEPIGPPHTVTALPGDLAREGVPAVADADLVTASALLDLVTEEWLASLVDACRAARCGALFALSYDGAIVWSGRRARDHDADDALIPEAINAHQRRDKGLGPALGPSATWVAERLFRDAGFRTWVAPTPWRLSHEDAPLALALVAGWERAACEEMPEREERIRAWAERRRNAIATRTFRLVVGHLDLLALPTDPK